MSAVALAAIITGSLGGVACSSQHKATPPPSSSTSSRPDSTTNPRCGAAPAAAAWPVTGAAQTTSWSAIPLVVSRFLTGEFALSATGERVDQRPDDCILHVQTAVSSANVQIMGGPGSYRITGFDYPDPGADVALSIAIQGKSVHVYTPLCAGCKAVFKIRYANTKSEASSPDGQFRVTLREKPSGPGTLVVIVTKNNRIVRANGLQLPAGNFAAS